MSRTSQDLATETMRRLTLLEAQEEPDAADAAQIISTYTGKLAEWTFREMAWWTLDEIPEMAFGYVADQMAEENASHFGKAVPLVFDEGGQQVSIGERGRRGIKRLAMKERTGLPVMAQYF